LLRDQVRLAQQIIELQRELGRVVAFDVERERLWEDRREALAVVALEADLARVEGKREPERDVQAFDAELEPLQPSGGRRARLGRTQRTRFLGFSPDS
jgi:hypothetical protein